MPRRPFHSAMTSPEAPSWQAQFALLAAIWGSSFLLIKVADESLTPLQVALGRVVFGTAAVLCVLAVRRQRLAFSPEATTAASVLAEVSRRVEVRDLAVEEPDIEDVVRRLYLADRRP